MRITGYTMALAVGCFLPLATASGSTILYSATGTNWLTGNALSAQAQFTTDETSLTIVLTNTAAANDHYKNSDILIALFFGNSALNLTPQRAEAPKMVNSDGSVNCSGVCDESGFWQYRTVSPQFSARNGISTAGLGIFQTNAGPFFGVDDGELARHGIAPGNWAGGGPGRVTFAPLAVNSVSFTLSLPDAFVLSADSIGPVTFQFGTSLSEPHLLGCTGDCGGGGGGGSTVPEPLTFALIGGGLLVFALLGGRRPRGPA